MRQKIWTSICILLIFTLALSACSKPTGVDGANTDSQIQSKPKDCRDPEVFCVSLVTDVGEVDDKSFNQSAWEGVQQAGLEVGAIVKYIETKDAKDYAPDMQLFADEGFDVIVTVGFAVGAATI